MCFPTQIVACCAHRCSYLLFSYPLRPRAESATFLLATVGLRLGRKSPDDDSMTMGLSKSCFEITR
jgi:hypothetical protein